MFFLCFWFFLFFSLDFDLGTHTHTFSLSLSLSLSHSLISTNNILYFGFLQMQRPPLHAQQKKTNKKKKTICICTYCKYIILYNYPCHRFWESSFIDFKQFSKCVKLFRITKLVLYAWSRASQLANSSLQIRRIPMPYRCMYIYIDVRSQLKNHRNCT